MKYLFKATLYLGLMGMFGVICMNLPILVEVTNKDDNSTTNNYDKRRIYQRYEEGAIVSGLNISDSEGMTVSDSSFTVPEFKKGGK